MIATVPMFTKLSEACKKRFNTLFMQYKCDKMANGVSGESKHESKF